jgi:hypothetical protein
MYVRKSDSKSWVSMIEVITGTGRAGKPRRPCNEPIARLDLDRIIHRRQADGSVSSNCDS